MNSNNKAFAPVAIPGFINIAELCSTNRVSGARTGTVGVNRNAGNNGLIALSISNDLADQIGVKDKDRIEIFVKGHQVAIMKGGSRLVTQGGRQFRATMLPLFIVEEGMRLSATVVPADVSDPDKPRPAYITFTLPQDEAKVKKNPKYYKQ